MTTNQISPKQRAIFYIYHSPWTVSLSNSRRAIVVRQAHYERLKPKSIGGLRYAIACYQGFDTLPTQPTETTCINCYST